MYLRLKDCNFSANIPENGAGTTYSNADATLGRFAPSARTTGSLKNKKMVRKAVLSIPQRETQHPAVGLNTRFPTPTAIFYRCKNKE